MMAKIVGVSHIFINQVRKFNYISILQKEKGVDSNTSPLPPPPFPFCIGILLCESFLIEELKLF